MPAGRAAVFSQQSQRVEVLVEGAWWPGSLLGWRHDGAGACQVWVRATVAGTDRETWTDLAWVRLPEVAPAAGPALDAGPFAGPAEEILPGASAAPLLSLSEAAAREQAVAGALPSSAPAVSRRRRRHGGDVTAELPAASAGAGPGRHRAGGGVGMAGRHRALDAAPPTEEAPAAEAADATVLMPRATDVDCLTRPLRLSDRVSRPRLVRPDEALRA